MKHLSFSERFIINFHNFFWNFRKLLALIDGHFIVRFMTGGLLILRVIELRLLLLSSLILKGYFIEIERFFLFSILVLPFGSIFRFVILFHEVDKEIRRLRFWLWRRFVDFGILLRS